MSETMYRCIVCGKWSHAAHQPKKHMRFIRSELTTKPPSPDIVIDETYDDQGSIGGWMVWCGPFEVFHAEPEQPRLFLDCE